MVKRKLRFHSDAVGLQSWDAGTCGHRKVGPSSQTNWPWLNHLTTAWRRWGGTRDCLSEPTATNDAVPWVGPHQTRETSSADLMRTPRPRICFLPSRGRYCRGGTVSTKNWDGLVFVNVFLSRSTKAICITMKRHGSAKSNMCGDMETEQALAFPDQWASVAWRQVLLTGGRPGRWRWRGHRAESYGSANIQKFQPTNMSILWVSTRRICSCPLAWFGFLNLTCADRWSLPANTSPGWSSVFLFRLSIQKSRWMREVRGPPTLPIKAQAVNISVSPGRTVSVTTTQLCRWHYSHYRNYT